MRLLVLLVVVLLAPFALASEEDAPSSRDGVCGLEATVLRRQSTAVWLELEGAAVPFLIDDTTQLVGLESTTDLVPGLPITIDSSVHNKVINRLDAVAGPGERLDRCVSSAVGRP
jgi:hypothetical protein